uniref:Uncharacterized protein n=1 Tax=Zea mays TaxID=4577 RepID=A0A804MKD9_MAIZE
MLHLPSHGSAPGRPLTQLQHPLAASSRSWLQIPQMGPRPCASRSSPPSTSCTPRCMATLLPSASSLPAPSSTNPPCTLVVPASPSASSDTTPTPSLSRPQQSGKFVIDTLTVCWCVSGGRA